MWVDYPLRWMTASISLKPSVERKVGTKPGGIVSPCESLGVLIDAGPSRPRESTVGDTLKKTEDGSFLYQGACS